MKESFLGCRRDRTISLFLVHPVTQSKKVTPLSYIAHGDAEEFSDVSPKIGIVSTCSQMSRRNN